MEIILTLIKYFTASLTPWQFLAVIAILGVATAFTVRFALNKRKAIRFLLSSKPEEDENLSAINKKLTNFLTREEFDARVVKLELVIRHELTEATKSVTSLKEKFVEITMLRQEIVDREFSRLFEAVGESRTVFTAHHEHAAKQAALILSSTSRLQEAQMRTLSQVEKIDEFVKAAVPEFRGYHRELSSDLKLLSRDLALIERSVQLGINSGSAVKLR